MAADPPPRPAASPSFGSRRPAVNAHPAGCADAGFTFPSSQRHFVDVASLAGSPARAQGRPAVACELLGTRARRQGRDIRGPGHRPFSLDLRGPRHRSHLAVLPEIARIPALGLARPIDQIYSAASIGKAHLDAMGVRPARAAARHAARAHRFVMSCYFGGRSEVHLRRESPGSSTATCSDVPDGVLTHGSVAVCDGGRHHMGRYDSRDTGFLDGRARVAASRPTVATLTTIVELVHR